MRLKNEIVQDGYFWLPGGEGSKIFGTFIMRENENIHIELKGLFEGETTSPDNDIFDTVHGYTDHLGYITFSDCFYTKQDISFGGMSNGSATLLVNHVYTGDLLTNPNDLHLKSLTFRFDHLDEWLSISGIKVERQSSNSEKPNAIYYNKPNPIYFDLGEGFSLSIDFSYSIPGFPNITEAKFTQKAFFNLTSDKPCALSELDKMAHKILRLISLFIGTPLVISDLVAKTFTEDKIIKIFYKSAAYAKKENISFHDMNFLYKHIEGDLGELIRKWSTSHDLLLPSISLYFSSFTGQNALLDARFLSLVQGLETFHRRTSSEKYMDEDLFKKLVEELLNSCPEEHVKWLKGRTMHGNEISLNRRLELLMAPFSNLIGNQRTLAKLARKISTTRNYKTHYDPSAENAAVDGIDMYKLIVFMECLLNLLFLNHINFPIEKLNLRVENNSCKLNKLLKYSLSK